MSFNFTVENEYKIYHVSVSHQCVAYASEYFVAANSKPIRVDHRISVECMLVHCKFIN